MKRICKVAVIPIKHFYASSSVYLLQYASNVEQFGLIAQQFSVMQCVIVCGYVCMLFHKGAEISFSIVSLALCLRESVFTVEISLPAVVLFSVPICIPEFRSDAHVRRESVDAGRRA